MSKDRLACFHCGSPEYISAGNYIWKGQKIKRYQCKQCGKKFNEKNAREIEDETKVLTEDTYVKDYKYEEKKESSTMEGHISSKITDRVKILDDFLDLCSVDLVEWEVERYLLNAWDVTMKIGEYEATNNGNEGYSAYSAQHAETYTNYQIKVWLVKKKEEFNFSQFKQELYDDLVRVSPVVELKDHGYCKSGNLLEINIPDLHLGKQSWAEETGFKDYDIKIAVERYVEAINAMLYDILRLYNIDRVLFIVGNDLFNSDTAYPFTQTTAGTPMQDDTRWQKVFRKGRNLMIDTIDLLTDIAPVDVQVIPGNHDFQKSFYLGEVLDIKFENNPNVTIDNTPKTRKYYNWGDCMLGFAHGGRRDEGEARLLSNMPHEAPKYCDIDWKDIKFKEWHCGDIHHYKEIKQKGTKKAVDKYAEDIDGVIIKYLRTLMFNDEWEAKKGYISQKGAHAFIWNKEKGNIAEFKFNN